MKKRTLISILLIIIGIFSSCHEDDRGKVDLLATAPIVSAMKQGTWHITNYVDHGSDETDHFTGYDFTFGSGNVLTATNGTNTYSGLWTLTSNQDDDETPNNKIDFNILFTEPADFEDISDDWDIVTRTATKIDMIDVSDGGTDIDRITFEKN